MAQYKDGYWFAPAKATKKFEIQFDDFISITQILTFSDHLYKWLVKDLPNWPYKDIRAGTRYDKTDFHMWVYEEFRQIDFKAPKGTMERLNDDKSLTFLEDVKIEYVEYCDVKGAYVYKVSVNNSEELEKIQNAILTEEDWREPRKTSELLTKLKDWLSQ